MELGGGDGSWVETGGAGWRRVELGGGGWSWVVLGERFSITHFSSSFLNGFQLLKNISDLRVRI